MHKELDEPKVMPLGGTIKVIETKIENGKVKCYVELIKD